MSKYMIEDTTLTGIADAIREKEGSSEAIPVSNFKTRIQAIETTPDDALFLEDTTIVNVSGSDVTEETVQATGILDDELTDQDAKIAELQEILANKASATITVTDDGAGTVSFTIPNVAVTHSDGTVTIE